MSINNGSLMTTNKFAAQVFIFNTFGYHFNNVNFLNEALDTAGMYRASSNQSLALIGDSVLQTNIYRDWYPTRQPKGTGNQLVQAIGSNANLAKVARRIGLDAHIVQNPGQRYSAPSEKTLATTLEAILGAIDRDSGEDADAVRKVMNRLGLAPSRSHGTEQVEM